MIGNNYYIKSINDKKLRNLGYRYIPSEDVYVLRFPLDKYNNHTVIEGKIIIYADTRKVSVDVYTENGESYAPYYQPLHPGFEEYVESLHNKIYSRFKTYNIIERRKRGRRRNEKIKNSKTYRNSKTSN